MPRKKKPNPNFSPTKAHLGSSFRAPASMLSTPSGKCPVELMGTSDEEILEWALAIKTQTQKGYEHTINSIQYWVRDFYNPMSPEWKHVRQRLEDLKEEIGLRLLPPPKIDPELLEKFKKDRARYSVV